nr:hypothetical protein [Tanacetum cinerariifolium]
MPITRSSKAQLATNAPVAEDMSVKVVIGPATVLLGAVQAGAFKMGDIAGTRSSKAQLATNAPVVIGPATVLLGAVQAGAFKMGDIAGTRTRNLKRLSLSMCLTEQADIVCSLFNAKFPKFRETQSHGGCGYYTYEYFYGFNLDHLIEVKIHNFRNLALRLEIVKLIMAKSPVLKKKQVELTYYIYAVSF